MLAALLERQGGELHRAAAQALLEPRRREARAQGAAARAVRAARQAQGAGGRDRAGAGAARGSRAAADEPAGRRQRDGLLPVAPSLASRRAAARAVRQGAADAAREARARAAAGCRDREARAAARCRSRKRSRGSPRSAGSRPTKAAQLEQKLEQHEQLSCACSARPRSSARSRGCTAAGRCSRRSSRSCESSPRRSRASRCRSPKSCRSTAAGSSIRPSSRSRSISSCTSRSTISRRSRRLSTERAVGDMKFGDRRDCDRMVERIREKIEELKQQKTLADQVKRRTDLLLTEIKYRNDTDSVPERRVPAVDQPHAGRASQRARDRAPHERRAAAHQRASPTTTGTCSPSCAERSLVLGAGFRAPRSFRRSAAAALRVLTPPSPRRRVPLAQQDRLRSSAIELLDARQRLRARARRGACSRA